MPLAIPRPTRVLFFTGKGGVGKTSSACATAIGLADRGRRVLLVSTDPASNLDEVLGVTLTGAPTAVPGVPGLAALNIDPEQAARAYRDRVVGPYRNLLPAAAVASMEEQLSGACTVEIAAFDELAKLLGDPALTADLDHVIFDTAPTGHTLRLLELPAAWTAFLDSNVGGTSCLGPLAGLAAQQHLYAAASAALRDPTMTTLVLVARPDRASLAEAERTRSELALLGVRDLRLIVNGLFEARDASDPIAVAMVARARAAEDAMPAGLRALDRIDVPLRAAGVVGVDALRALGAPADVEAEARTTAAAPPAPTLPLSVATLVDELARSPRGVVMTAGKGGVGKTTLAVRLATELARRGLAVTLTTTDPAADLAQVVAEVPGGAARLELTRIDAAAETRRYRAEVLATAGAGLDAAGRALLEEDLRSPCTEEIAVFRAFAETVARGEDRVVVIDTAPTGHTLLLLDAAESYHREILRKPSGSPEAVQRLLPRLRDPAFTRIVLVALPEATPIHEAMQLERDLARAQIAPFAWVVNQSLTPLAVSDPMLRARRAHEAVHLRELEAHTDRLVLEPWRAASPAVGPASGLDTTAAGVDLMAAGA